MPAILLACFVAGCAANPLVLPGGASGRGSDASAQPPGGAHRTRLSTYSGDTGRWPQGDYQPFDGSSWFNTPIAGDDGFLGAYSTDKNSAAVVATIFANGGLAGEAFAVPAGAQPNANPEYAYPFYYAHATDPLYSIHCTASWGTCPIEGKLVHIPAGAQPENSGGSNTSSDHHMAILDTTIDVEYDFYGSSVPNGTSSTVATQLPIVFGGSGPIFDQGGVVATGYGAQNQNPEPFQSTHLDVALTAGIVRPADLLSSDGAIDHALQISVPCSGSLASPASVYPFNYVNNTDTPCPSSVSNPPQYGMRLLLKATSSQIASLGLNAFQTSLWTAMAKYGAIVSDSNGFVGIGFQAEDPLTYTTQGGANLWDTVAANQQPAVAKANYGQGDKYYFALAPNASAASFIQSNLVVVTYGVNCSQLAGLYVCPSYER